MAKYLVKEAELIGHSRNPFRRGGVIAKHTAWKTIAKCDTMNEAVKVMHSRTTGLFKRGIWYKGQRVDGRSSS